MLEHGYGRYLADEAAIAVIGGGPAGSFFAIHLLSQARALGLRPRLTIFEHPHRRAFGTQRTPQCAYRGCPFCAGGLSPRVVDELGALGIELPPQVIESRVTRIVSHAHWKNISLAVPRNRRMISVFRGKRPPRPDGQSGSFDEFLLDRAVGEGARLSRALACDVRYTATGLPSIDYRTRTSSGHLDVDFAVFAGGVNQERGAFASDIGTLDLFRKLQPEYRPPATRKTLIFEVAAPPDWPAMRDGELHLFHLRTAGLDLQMCSIIPKAAYMTVSLIGSSVDETRTREEQQAVIHRFLRHRSVAAVVPPDAEARIRCACSPRIVTGTARRPVGHRIAAIGDMATSRLYKDGILSSCMLARSLAETLLAHGIDEATVTRGYGSALADFDRDRRYGKAVFGIYEAVFARPTLSRFLYQAFISEVKARPREKRRITALIWKIASGDADYGSIIRDMLSPATLWVWIRHGCWTTGANYLVERFFGLQWRDLDRYPTGISASAAGMRRRRLMSLVKDAAFFSPGARDFESIYTIAIGAPARVIHEELGKLGDADRRWLIPRWVGIRRIAGNANEVGSVIRYAIFGGLLQFEIELIEAVMPTLLVYRVRGGFAHGGLFCFDIEESGDCRLSIYLGFDYFVGRGLLSRGFWRTFRFLFPESIHDVLWNNALCQLKQLCERPTPGGQHERAGRRSVSSRAGQGALRKRP